MAWPLASIASAFAVPSSAQALGEAVVTDQGAVPEGIQSFRRRAQAAGNLKSDDKQVLSTNKEIFIVQPANREVIYVLQYARKLASTPGKQDGVNWGAQPVKEPSPFGPPIAESTAYLQGHAVGDPYRGWRFRILTRQGKNAPGVPATTSSMAL